MSDNPVHACESDSTKKMLLQDNSWTTSLHVHVILLKTKNKRRTPSLCSAYDRELLSDKQPQWLDMIVRTSLRSAL